ncbi:MAG: Mbeg1-like protein [Synechococcus sp.]
MPNFIQRIFLSLSGSHSRERVADAVWGFLERPDIENVLAILDFRDYETFEIEVPRKYARYTQTFRIDDAFLKRALRPYNEMSAIAKCIEQLEKYGEDNGVAKKLVDNSKKAYQTELRNTLSKYKQNDEVSLPAVIESEIQSKIDILDDIEKDISDIVSFISSFKQEIIVRGWFHDFLDGLARFEVWIKSGVTTASELEPFLIRWIEVIGDREKRRIGGATFYESLFQFIEEAGYQDVQALFRRFGFDISKSLYPQARFLPFADDKPKSDRLSHLHKALSLSMAADLCYADYSYIKDWILKWNEMALREIIDARTPETSTDTPRVTINAIADYATVADAPRVTMNAIVDYVKTKRTGLEILKGNEPYQDEELSLEFFEDKPSETFAIAFTLMLPKRVTIVAFRGTINLQNWITNLNVDPTQLPEAKLSSNTKSITVHEGFLKATQKVQKDINDYLGRQQPKEVYFTGHSLGGALAVLSAVNLSIAEEQKNNIDEQKERIDEDNKDYRVNIAGVYTFGQPKVGANSFQAYYKGKFGNEKLIRFVNNSDIVPRIPNIISLLNLNYLFRSWRIYNYQSNIGQRYYISYFGNILYPKDGKAFLVFIRDRLIGIFRFIIAFPKVIWILDHSISLYIKYINKNIKRLESRASSRDKN